MPKTKLSRYAEDVPALDHAWGSVLSRMQAMGLSIKELSERTGYHYDTVRKTMTKPPIDWPPEQREQILNVLKLRAKMVIEDAN